MGSSVVAIVAVAAVVLLLVGAAVYILLLFRRQRQERIDTYERAQAHQVALQRAIWAGATVVSARSQPVGHPHPVQVRVDLRLEVCSPGGGTYMADTIWEVDPVMLSQLQPGESISVKIDVEDPSKIYPNMSGATYLQR